MTDRGSDHHLPRLQHVWSTASIFKEANVIFTSNISTFLFLSLLIFSFRTFAQTGALHVTSFIDNNPSIRALLSRLDQFSNGSNTNAGNNRPRLQAPDDSSAAAAALRRRRRPFDSFSGDDDEGRSLFGYNRKAAVNGTAVLFGDLKMKSGFSDLVVDNGIKVSEVVHSEITFEAENVQFTDMIDRDLNGDDQGNENEDVGSEDVEESDRVSFSQFTMNGLDFGRRDWEALYSLTSVLFASYGCVMLVFVFTYSWVLGIVFVTVANDLLGRDRSFLSASWDGSRLGKDRLCGVILMKWLVRDVSTHLLAFYHFVGILDRHSFLKLLVRLKLMSFSLMSPWVRGFEEEFSSFLFYWIIVDSFVAFMFSVDAGVAIADPRKTCMEIVGEGLDLTSTMMGQAVQIKCYEDFFCGPLLIAFWWKLFGTSFTMFFQSTMEVYFMVVWLIYYFAARCRDAELQGKRFGERELEGMLRGL